MKKLILTLLCSLFFSTAQAQEDEAQLLKSARLGRVKDIIYSYEMYSLQTFSFLQIDVYLKAESKSKAKKNYLNVMYMGAGGRMDKPAEISFKAGIIKVKSVLQGKTKSVCYQLNKPKTHFRPTKCFK